MNNEKKINKIIVYTTPNGYFGSADIFYENGTNVIGIKGSDVSYFLAIFTIQEKVDDYKELIKQGKVISGENRDVIVPPVVNNTTNNSTTNNTTTSNATVQNNTSASSTPTQNNSADSENNTKKKRLIGKTIVATTFGSLFFTGLIVGLIYAGSKFQLVRRSKPVNTKSPTKTTQPVVSVPTRVPSGTTVNSSRLVKVVNRSGSANETFNQNLNDTVNRSDEFIDFGYRVASGERVSSDKLDDFLNRINSLLYSSATELSNYIILGEPMKGSEYFPSFELFFEPGSVDYYLIQNMLNDRKNIIEFADNNKCNTQNRETAKEKVKLNMDNIVDCIYNSKPYPGTNAFYADLSPLAQFLLNSNLRADLTIIDYSKSLNGKKMNKIDWINQVLSTLTNVMNGVNNKNRKY